MEDFLTKEFVRVVNKERRAKGQVLLAYRTQIDLAIVLIRAAQALLPVDLELWVVADNFFEGPKLDAVCSSMKGIYYVVPLDKGRVLAGEAKNGKPVKVRDFERKRGGRICTEHSAVMARPSVVLICYKNLRPGGFKPKAKSQDGRRGKRHNMSP
ncbi:MAG: hypothetical protein HYU64_15620 [Armatimonadetes bacterium]|nr:hypothetical protein [Armatimonadota bacterium]